MALIPQKEFSRLRLNGLMPDKKISRVWGFEYLGRVWFGEQFAFSHVLRLFSKPFATKSIAIDLSDVSDAELHEISKILGLAVRRSYTAEECIKSYGDPVNTDEFVMDRKTYEFHLENAYEVGFTILHSGGLLYFTMNTIDVAYNQSRKANA